MSRLEERTIWRFFRRLPATSIQARSAGEERRRRFTIRLARAAVPRADHPGGAAEEMALRPRRIIIVEDNEDAWQMFKALLELASHEVHDAADGSAGIELVAAVEAGFDMHLLKPVDPGRLSAIIAALPPRRPRPVSNGRVVDGLV